MPGVPSGRGCEACRGQKKKCDQGRPACSRCTRLRLPCVGAGQQRYVFKTATTGPSVSWTKFPVSASSPAGSPVHDRPSPPPSNSLSLTAGRFVSALEVSDARFDITVYGEFLRDIPRRLGSSKALDASVQAFVGTVQGLYPRQQSPEVYENYVAAINALRLSLDDPSGAVSANTLCAIYLVMICQYWLDTDHSEGGSPKHGVAIAHLVNSAASRLPEWHGWFEEQILASLAYVVILFSCSTPGIHLDPRIMAYKPQPLEFGPLTEAIQDSQIHSLRIENVARLPSYLRHPLTHLADIRAAYQTVQIDLGKIERLFAATFPSASRPELLPPRVEKIYLRVVIGQGFLVLIAIILNVFIYTYDFGLNALDRLALAEDTSKMVDIALWIADQTSRYRPLGASSVPICLVGAYGVSEDEEKKAQLLHYLAEFQKELPSSDWLELATSARKHFHRLKGQASPLPEPRDGNEFRFAVSEDTENEFNCSMM